MLKENKFQDADYIELKSVKIENVKEVRLKRPLKLIKKIIVV